jgi:hypothetical protein
MFFDIRGGARSPRARHPAHVGDATLREAERRARATASVDDAARLLLERVRVGDLPIGGLTLAAYLGDPAACAAIGEPRSLTDDATDLDAALWARGLIAWGEEALARGLVASCMTAMERLPEVDEQLRAESIAAFEPWWREATVERHRDLALGVGIPDVPTPPGARAHPLGAFTKMATLATWGQKKHLLELTDHTGALDLRPSAMSGRLLPWALAGGPASSGPRPPDISGQALVAGTSAERRALVQALRAAVGQEVLLQGWGTITRRFLVHSVTPEGVHGLHEGAEHWFPLRRVRNVSRL